MALFKGGDKSLLSLWTHPCPFGRFLEDGYKVCLSEARLRRRTDRANVRNGCVREPVIKERKGDKERDRGIVASLKFKAKRERDK